MIGTSLGALAARVFAAKVGAVAFLLVLVFVCTVGTQAIAQTMTAPDDADGSYEVTVQVSDGSDSDSADLVVTLENVVELTALSGPSTVDYEENRAVRVATYSASSEADQDGLTWSLSGADADSFRIDEPAGVLRFDLAVVSPNLFSPPPDYDAPADADSDGTYKVTVEVGDGVTSHSLAVEVTITDQDEAGTLTLSATRPQFGVALTISTHGRGVLKVGSVAVAADGPIGGVLRFDIPALGVAGVGDSPPVRDALVPVRRQEGGINTGVAVHNRGTTALLVRCLTPAPGLFSAVAFELDGVNRIFTTLPVFPVVEVP